MPRAADQPIRPDAHQVRVARPKADTYDLSHRPFRLAVALTAATVIAEPPSLP